MLAVPVTPEAKPVFFPLFLSGCRTRLKFTAHLTLQNETVSRDVFRDLSSYSLKIFSYFLTIISPGNV